MNMLLDLVKYGMDNPIEFFSVSIALIILFIYLSYLVVCAD